MPPNPRAPEWGHSAPEWGQSHPGDLEHTLSITNIVLQAVLFALGSASVAIRTYVRAKIVQQLGLEDVLAIAGFLLAASYSVVCSALRFWGGGKHQWHVHPGQISNFRITMYVTMLVYGPCAFCIKAAILLFLVRVFAPIKRAVKSLHVFIGVMLAYYTMALLLKSQICRPIQKFWNQDLDGRCLNQQALLLGDAAVSVLSDLTILIAPIPLALNLMVTSSRKLKIIAVFGAGGVVCIFSVARFVEIAREGNSKNQTFVFARMNIYAMIEIYVGLIALSMPVMPAFWKQVIRPKLRRRPMRYTTSYTGDTNGSMLTTIGAQSNESFSRRAQLGGSGQALITEITLPSKTLTRPMRIGTSCTVSTDLPRRDSMQSTEDGAILKTVEVRRTYD
ncbi:hypothetical protein BCR34DRAFT_338650 [Clohesyomyces aquaticus]|uniref:Rhodopsin domain-containing protein n=1 Tax=Clohesyomyces aquaticus TaxID=1231657 RepID=A0A1Y1ZM24_9PLEO|nr:hypothetical protein BCR34DRAFT_338650 [Clohesyomyces aquaticus]